VRPADELVVAVTSYAAGRAAWAAVEGEPIEAEELPLLVRDVVAAWLVQRGGIIDAADFLDPAQPRWQLPAEGPSCSH
jgi:hypothetical protein